MNLKNKILYNDLTCFTSMVLEKSGLDSFSENAVTLGLCETSLRGVDSHGIRLLPHYAASAKSGRKNPKPNFKFKQTFPCMGHLDADHAFGHAAGMKAIDHGIEMAHKFGCGIVGVSNSSHPGAMASFALKAARLGYMAFAFTHADALMLSANSTRPFFGTNPFCFAAPRKNLEPFCLDMATTMISWNKVLLARQNQQHLDAPLAADQNGLATDDPQLAKCLLPAGSYKGYGLGAMIDIFCGIFTGMNFGRMIPAMYSTPMEKTRNLGQFYMVMRVDGCISSEEFMEQLNQMSQQVSLEPRMGDAPVMLPGDREIMVAKQRMENGIPLDQATLTALQKLSQEMEVPLNIF
jgi:LDH2 family malate/lactate/ureidoglycolate dehydrogenase